MPVVMQRQVPVVPFPLLVSAYTAEEVVATLDVDNGDLFMAGVADSMLLALTSSTKVACSWLDLLVMVHFAQSSLYLSAGPRSSASWWV